MSAFLLQHPEIALFLSVSLGHLIGMARFGPIQLGGVCGTLIVALLLGQTGVRLENDVKTVFFALFIFALGYTGGPQFFANIASGWRFGILSLVEAVTVLAVVMTAAVMLSLNPGAAAGLLAGAATESAVIGTASEAIGHLPLDASAAESLQGQIATAYSITYLFGLITIVIFTTQIAPLLLGVDLRKASAELSRKLGQDIGGSQHALPELVGRAFFAGPAAGGTVMAFEAMHRNAVTIARMRRAGETIDPSPDTTIQDGDQLLIVGRRAAILEAVNGLGGEVARIGVDLPVVTRDFVLGKSAAVGRSLEEVRRLAPLDTRRGVYITGLRRLGRDIPTLPDCVLQSGDVVRLFGTERAVIRAGNELGRVVEASSHTDFIMLGLGVVSGALIGLMGVTIGGIHLTLGVGGGCLLSGLVFGWYSARHAGIGAFPPSAAQILKDFGLAAFIAAVGFSAGPDALRLIGEYGFWLPLAGILSALIPASLSLFIGHRLLKIEAPFLLGAIAGQQCSTPAISALVNTSGSSIPVVGYTVTYAISNVLLPLLGPLVVGLVFHMN
ncbi:MAG: aspartate-alanine antiporter [Novosphingobium sp.]|nr:aspartate-alanine antiporter [Novosphingobium sp.]